MASYSQMSYSEALRKEPTNYKLRAMGKKRYDLKYKKDKSGKTTVKISTKNDPKDYPSYSEQVKGKGKSSSKSLLNRKGSGTQQTNYDDIRKPGQVGTPSGEKARESQSAGKDNKPQTGKQLAAMYGAGATLAGTSLLTRNKQKQIENKQKRITDQRKPKKVTDNKVNRETKIEVNKKGEAKEVNAKDTKVQKARRLAVKAKEKAKETGKKVLSKAKDIGKKAGTKAKSLLKFRKFFNPGTAAGSIAFGASVPKASALEDLSVAQLKKMGMSDAQIKKLKGK